MAVSVVAESAQSIDAVVEALMTSVDGIETGQVEWRRLLVAIWKEPAVRYSDGRRGMVPWYCSGC